MRARQVGATIVKRGARPLVRAGGETLAAVVERRLRGTALAAGVAVAYHSVAATTGDPALELVPAHGVDLFEGELRHLAGRYRVVAAEELERAVAERRPGERFPAAITFDDDLASHVSLALPVLQRLGVTATFFLSGASLETPFSFWWERLQRAVDSGAPVPDPSFDEPPRIVERSAIRRLGRAAEELTTEDRHRWAEALLETAGPDPADAGMRAADVRALADAGMTIGFHTRRHDPMTTLDDDRLAVALRDGRAELEQLAEQRVSVIGYPHGRADERVAAAARTAGFDVGFTTVEAAVTPLADGLLLGRINPSYRSVGHFALQLARSLLAAHR
ncbi:MAG: polysaccharide deacetylase family protein [Actinomycetota bacterium]